MVKEAELPNYRVSIWSRGSRMVHLSKVAYNDSDPMLVVFTHAYIPA